MKKNILLLLVATGMWLTSSASYADVQMSATLYSHTSNFNQGVSSPANSNVAALASSFFLINAYNVSFQISIIGPNGSYTMPISPYQSGPVSTFYPFSMLSVSATSGSGPYIFTISSDTYHQQVSGTSATFYGLDSASNIMLGLGAYF